MGGRDPKALSRVKNRFHALISSLLPSFCRLQGVRDRERENPKMQKRDSRGETEVALAAAACEEFACVHGNPFRSYPIACRKIELSIHIVPSTFTVLCISYLAVSLATSL